MRSQDGSFTTSAHAAPDVMTQRASRSVDLMRHGRGQPVILLHGFCGSAQSWLPTVVDLCRTHDVIAPDWPGYGHHHDMAPCRSVTEMAEWVIALADELGLQRFHVIGHSMSGYVVQQLLVDHPDRVHKAVLYGAGLRMDHARRFESAKATIARLQREGIRETVAHVVSTWFVAGARDPAYAQCVGAGSAMTMDAALAAMNACRDVDYTGRLRNVAAETLVIMGERERTFPLDMAIELAHELSASSLCVLPWCAHAAHLEQPDLFNRVVSRFLSRSD